jgi:hypothetical protein
MPIAAVAGEPRCLDCQHRASAAITNRNEQSFEALSGDSAAGATKVVINNDYILSSESFGSPLQGVLAAATLRVVGELIGGDLIHRAIPFRLRPTRTRSRAASGD